MLPGDRTVLYVCEMPIAAGFDLQLLRHLVWRNFSTLNQNTLSLSFGRTLLAVYISLMVWPRFASMRDTGGVAVKGR